MIIQVAQTSGFCFGVQRAVDTAEKVAAPGGGKVYTWGPVVHNENVIKDLEEKGVSVLYSEADLDEVEPGSTIIIRAHGIKRELEEKLKAMPITLVDATCPFVKKIHKAVAEHSKKGEEILVCGDPLHPEVEGIVGWCNGPVQVIQTEEEAKKYTSSANLPICMVVQTTFNHKKFQKIVEIIEKKDYNLTKLDTVCLSTHERQEEARKLAKNVDLMLVIGSKASSNSQKLYEICSSNCEKTYFISDKADLQAAWFDGVENVGITAGASTPKNIIQEVQNNVRKF